MNLFNFQPTGVQVPDFQKYFVPRLQWVEKFLRWMTGLFCRSWVGIIVLLFLLYRLRATVTVTHAPAEPEGGDVVFLVRKLVT